MSRLEGVLRSISTTPFSVMSSRAMPLLVISILLPILRLMFPKWDSTSPEATSFFPKREISCHICHLNFCMKGLLNLCIVDEKCSERSEEVWMLL